MGIISLRIPAVGQSDSTEEPKVASNFNTLQALLNGNIDDNNLRGGISDSKLASPQAGVRREILTTKGVLNGLTGAQTVLMGTRTGAVGRSCANGAGGDVSTTDVEPLPDFVYIDPADFAVAGKTTMLVLRTMWFTNTVAPGQRITIGLYPWNSQGGGANNITFGVDTATVLLLNSATPGANSFAKVTTEMNIASLPGVGAYGIGMAQANTLGAGAVVAGYAQLAIYHA